MSNSIADQLLATARRHPKVMVAWCDDGSTIGAFTDSLAHLMLVNPGGYVATYTRLESGPRVAEARSQLVDAFLADPLGDGCDWMFMVDADMGFDHDVVQRLLAVADAAERPVVGGLCFAGGADSCWPTLYRFTDPSGEMDRIDDYPADTLVKVDATGAAALLIHKRVFAEMKLRYGTLPNGNPNPYPWFQEGLITSSGKPIGEDIAFCARLARMNIPVHVHTGIRFDHHKRVVLNEERFLARKEPVLA